MHKHENGTGSFPAVTEAKERATSSEQYTIQTIAEVNLNFLATPNMLQINETIAQTLLKDLAQVELVLERIPTKELYNLQFSVIQEV
jgi:hypothetical protein